MKKKMNKPEQKVVQAFKTRMQEHGFWVHEEPGQWQVLNGVDSRIIDTDTDLSKLMERWDKIDA